jgi:hypothetical protein
LRSGLHLALSAASVLVGAAAHAALPASPPPLTPPPAVAPAVTPPPSLPAPAVEPPPSPVMGAAPAAATAAPPAAARPAPVPTADATAAPSDHDAVVEHVGIEVRRLDPVPFALALRTPNGCPVAQTTPCTVDMGAIEARYWATRNLGLAGGLALAFGGGRDLGRSLDTYFGIGPVVGMSLLLGNWRHLAVSASPDASIVWFRPAGGATSTWLIDLRAAVEGELHFGFIGVPALSVGIVSGLGFRFESTPDTRVWSVAIIGANSVASTLSTLFLRYYF